MLPSSVLVLRFFFFFNDTPPTEIYTLSLTTLFRSHGELPLVGAPVSPFPAGPPLPLPVISPANTRSEEHTSELQSLRHLVCRLLLEKKKDRLADAAVNDVSPSYGTGPRPCSAADDM